MNKNLVRSVVAVLGAFMVVAVLSVATDAVLEGAGLFPPATQPGAYTAIMLWLALAYRSLFTFIGGYCAAWWAPTSRMRHVHALMIVGGLAGVAGAIYGWQYGNHWYPVLLAVTGPVFVWMGGRYHQSRRPASD
jgi:hypothetical protein